MQLFLTDWVEKNNEIFISDDRVSHQMKTVLRAKEWTEFFVQKSSDESALRMKVRLKNFDDKKTIIAGIVSQEGQKNEIKSLEMYVAMPNKFDKCELIVQKLAEIWVSKIVFWVAERSQIRELSEQKLERLEKIAVEAVEQSRGWQIPRLSFEKNFSSDGFKKTDFFCVFDAGEKSVNPFDLWKILWDSEKIVWVVGPEGGLSPKDYELFGWKERVVSLGGTILRMETAAIVGWRLLRNLSRW